MDDDRIMKILRKAKATWVLGIATFIFLIAFVLNIVGYTEHQDSTFLSGLIIMLFTSAFLGIMYWSLYSSVSQGLERKAQNIANNLKGAFN